MVRWQDIETVLAEMRRLVGELQRGTRCVIGGTSDFDLTIWNGIRMPNDNTTTVRVWTVNAGTFESRARTVQEGLRDVISQMYRKLGRHPKHWCPICHEEHDGYDLTALPVDAFGELMQELADIAVKMHLNKMMKPAVGRNVGPTFNLKIKGLNRYAEIYFAEVQERFVEQIFSDYGRRWLSVQSKKGLCLMQSLEDVMTEVHQHFKKYSQHRCPICRHEH